MQRINRIRYVRYHSGNSSIFLFTFLKYSFYRVPLLNHAGKDRNLSLHKERHAWDEVCQEISAPQFIIDQHRCLMNPSASSDALDKGFMEKVDIFLLGRNPFFNSHLSQSIHQDPNINLIRTSSSTGLTRDTEPDGAAPENLLFHPHLDHPDDVVRPDVHIRGSGTTCRAFETLVTKAEFFSAPLFSFLYKRGINFLNVGHSLQFYFLPSQINPEGLSYETVKSVTQGFSLDSLTNKRIQHPKGLDRRIISQLTGVIGASGNTGPAPLTKCTVND